MWQRKQTLFLLASLVVVIICLLLPIGKFDTDLGVGETHILTNLGWATGTSTNGMLPAWPFFVLITITGILSVIDIFLYKNRRLQMSLCRWGMLSDMLWYVYYIVFYFTSHPLHVCFATCLPLVSCILLWLAKKGIKADDDLVKSMDRIR